MGRKTYNKKQIVNITEANNPLKKRRQDIARLQAEYLVELDYKNYLNNYQHDAVSLPITGLLVGIVRHVLRSLLENEQTVPQFTILLITVITLPLAFTIAMKVSALLTDRYPNGLISYHQNNLSFDIEMLAVKLLQAEVEHLKQSNAKLYSTICAIRNFGKAIAPAIFMQRVMGGVNSDFDVEDYFIWNLFKDILMLFVFYSIQDKEEMSAQTFATINDGTLKRLNGLIEGLTTLEWKVRGENLRNANTYFELTNPKISNEKNLEIRLQSKTIILPIKLFLRDVAFVIANIIKLPVYVLDNPILLVGSALRINENTMSAAQYARTLLERRLQRRFELQQQIPVVLDQLNKISKITCLPNWWISEIEVKQLPAVNFGVSFYKESPAYNELIFKFLSDIYQNRVSIAHSGLLIKDGQYVNESIFENAIANFVNNNSRQLNIFTASEMSIVEQNNIEEQIELERIIKEENELAKEAKAEIKAAKAEAYSKANPSSAQVTAVNASTEVIPKWNMGKYDDLAKRYPQRFKRLAEFGNGKTWAYLDEEKIDRKFGYGTAESFREVFRERDFIGYGHVPNQQGHVLDTRGFFKLKKLGGEHGDHRPAGYIEASSMDSESNLIVYCKRKHCPH